MSIMSENAEHVEREHATAQETNAASVESIGPTGTSNSSLGSHAAQQSNPRQGDVASKQIRMQRLTPEALVFSNEDLSADELKAQISYSARLKADGHRMQRGGKQAKCRCPFHDDSEPSFFVKEADNYGSCYGCEWHGDLIQYECDYHHVDFTTALHRLSTWLKTGGHDHRRIVTPIEEAPPFQFSEEQTQTVAKAAACLCANQELIDQIADSRKWLPETVNKLAQDGDLGWLDGRLAFIYSTGLKLRTWPGKGFAWGFGGNGLWRDRLLEAASTVYLTEGETDAISLLDCGIEEEAGVAVLAVPGAKAFKEQWALRFVGKSVVTCFDNDDAGQDGARRVHRLLAPVVSTLRTHSLKEVQ
jgi:hypothetical protein